MDSSRDWKATEKRETKLMTIIKFVYLPGLCNLLLLPKQCHKEYLLQLTQWHPYTLSVNRSKNNLFKIKSRSNWAGTNSKGLSQVQRKDSRRAFQGIPLGIKASTLYLNKPLTNRTINQTMGWWVWDRVKKLQGTCLHQLNMSRGRHLQFASLIEGSETEILIKIK